MRKRFFAVLTIARAWSASGPRRLFLPHEAQVRLYAPSWSLAERAHLAQREPGHVPLPEPASQVATLHGGRPSATREVASGGRSFFAGASAIATILTSLVLMGRERGSPADSGVWTAETPGSAIGKVHISGGRQIEDVPEPSQEQLAIEADMFIRAGQRARKELEGGWVSDEDREMHTNAIRLGRQAEASIEEVMSRFWGRMSIDDVKRAYQVFLANSQLCRQVLDKDPNEDETLLDIHFEACLKLAELRDACRALATSMQTCRPEQKPQLEWLLKGANHNLEQLIEVFQTWEQMHGRALKTAHEMDAEETLRGCKDGVGKLPVGLKVEGGLSRLHTQSHVLLKKEEEFELAKRIEKANLAYKDLSEFGWHSETRRSELVDRIRDGEIARQRLALMNLRLVASVSMQVQRRFRGQSSLTFDDLVQEGDVGLMDAINKYDWRRGYRFSTYATYYIRQAVRKAILDTGSTIRIPIARAEQIRKFRVAVPTLEIEHGRKPTQEELCDEIGVSKTALANIQEYAVRGNTVLELDAFMKAGGETTSSTRMSTVSDGSSSPWEMLANEEEADSNASMLSLTMQKLSREELTAVGMRYGLDGGDLADYQEIADALGKSRAAATKFVYCAINKLKRYTKKQLQEFGSVEEEKSYEFDQATLQSIYSKLMSTASPAVI
jgi:RNA polymerase nonessential primary-like sigma factor